MALAYLEPAQVMTAETALQRPFPDYSDSETVQLACGELLPGYEATRSETERVALLTRACLAAAPVRRVVGMGLELVVLDARQPSDVLCALWLARRAGLFEPPRGAPTRRPRARSRIDLVPLFERRTAVQLVAETMGVLYANAAYAEQLWARGRRQELMLGYAEEPPDGDRVSRWDLHRAERSLERQARERGLVLGVRHRGAPLSGSPTALVGAL
jgi:phosphoenolpyruvate carboxylase